VEQVDEELQGGVARRRGDEHVQHPVVSDLAAHLPLHQLAQPVQVRLTQSFGGEARRFLLQRLAGLEHVVEGCADVEQVDHHRLDHRLDRGDGDHQAPAGAAPHPRHLLVLEQPNGLAEHRSAHAVAFEQVGLGPEHLPLGPARVGDVGDDPGGDRRRELP
jgi:hypothetical protein